MSVRVLIVDDHPVVREGLRAMLRAASVEVVAEAGTGAEALRVASEQPVDVMLLDMHLPDRDGLDVLVDVKQLVPSIAVVMLTMLDDPALVRRAVASGAAGYLLKGLGRDELRAAVDAAAHGEAVLDPELLRSIVAASADTDRRPTRDPRGLSPVELDVLGLVASGLTNREIAGRLRWSVGTVKKYVQQILEKLGVADRTQAAVMGLRYGLIEQPEDPGADRS